VKFPPPASSYTPKHLAEKIRTSKSAVEGERKLVTVLFADLKGSMELLANRDPEEARKILKKYADEMRRSHAAVVKIRVGMNSGEVVVRSIGSDLHMDYTAVGQNTHLAARKQMAMPCSVLLTADVLRLAEGFVEVKPLGAVNVEGL
jgi:class 3 adenylate cyclase